MLWGIDRQKPPSNGWRYCRARVRPGFFVPLPGVVVQEIDLKKFPTLPGIYLMQGEAGEILYVGKAKNLRSRLRSYFSAEGDGRVHIRFLMNRVREIETIVTDTEKEALILENTLIKKHRPRYNIHLRDDKTYVSIRLDPRCRSCARSSATAPSTSDPTPPAVPCAKRSRRFTVSFPCATIRWKPAVAVAAPASSIRSASAAPPVTAKSADRSTVNWSEG
jgi:hypothetical protein